MPHIASRIQFGLPLWHGFTATPVFGQSWFPAGSPPEASVSGELGEPTPSWRYRPGLF